MNLIPLIIPISTPNDTWSSVVNTLNDENSDFSIVTTSITTSKLEVVDFSATSLWRFK